MCKKKRQGYDKNKSHQVATVLKGEQMDSVFERRQSLGIKTNSEYVRRLIFNDLSSDDLNLIDLQHIREMLDEANKHLDDANADLDYHQEKSKEHAKNIRLMEIKQKENDELLATMNTARDKWMNSFICLENAIFGNLAEIDGINQFDPESVPSISKERVANLKEELAKLFENKLMRKEFESRVEVEKREVQNQWIIIGKLEDTINSGEIKELFDLNLTPERKDKMIGSVRKLRDNLRKGNEAISNLEKPGFSFALGLLWRSIFKGKEKDE